MKPLPAPRPSWPVGCRSLIAGLELRFPLALYDVRTANNVFAARIDVPSAGRLAVLWQDGRFWFAIINDKDGLRPANFSAAKRYVGMIVPERKRINA